MFDSIMETLTARLFYVLQTCLTKGVLSETGYGQDIELYVVPIDIERTDNMSHTLSQLVMRWLWECPEFGENLKLN